MGESEGSEDLAIGMDAPSERTRRAGVEAVLLALVVALALILRLGPEIRSPESEHNGHGPFGDTQLYHRIAVNLLRGNGFSSTDDGSAHGTERIEPERYELSASPFYRFEPLEVDRRSFLRILSVAGGGLVVVATLPPGSAQESGRGQGAEGAATVESWLHLDDQGHLTAFTGKVEIGQNARTLLTQVVADELDIPAAAIAFVMGDTDRTPYDQGTFGSRTTPVGVHRTRNAFTVL